MKLWAKSVTLLIFPTLFLKRGSIFEALFLENTESYKNKIKFIRKEIQCFLKIIMTNFALKVHPSDISGTKRV